MHGISTAASDQFLATPKYPVLEGGGGKGGGGGERRKGTGGGEGVQRFELAAIGILSAAMWIRLSMNDRYFICLPSGLVHD